MHTSFIDVISTCSSLCTSALQVDNGPKVHHVGVQCFLPDNMQTRDFGVQCSLAIPHLTSSPLGHGSTATDSEMSDVEQEFEDPNTSHLTLSQSS